MASSEIKLPPLGENLAEGDVLEVKVSPGDVVSRGQAIVEIEAEKSTVEVPAPMDGKVTKVFVKKGDHIAVGHVLCLFDGADGQKGAPAAAPAKERPKEPDAPRPPKIEAAVARSASLETPVDNGKKEVEPQPAPPSAKLVAAGPATRRLARELGVDLSQVRGTATGGRVTQDDVKAFVRDSGPSVGSGAAVAVGTVPPLPDFAKWGPIERRPLDGIRRKTAEQMSLAWRLIPHVTQHDQADITDLEAFRKQEDGKGPKLTVTAFALKAVAIALKQFPQFNASLDVAGNALILKNYIHIGVAVDTERGLLVPVLRDVSTKSVRDLAAELAGIAERARQKKIASDELRGGTFTITNLGGIGGTAFTPIVNYPEVAILGLSRGRLQPVVKDGQIVPRLLLPLSLSYDHRVIDGADAARFTRRLAEMLEQPLVMLLDA